MSRLRSLAPIAVATLTLATLAACEQGRTAGDDLFGTWAQLDAPAGAPAQMWTFADDLTYDKTGAETGSGIFFVEGTRLTIEGVAPSPDLEHVSFDYVATDSHWLANAAYATGPVSGRVGTWQGRLEDHNASLVLDYIVTLRADRTVHETRAYHRDAGTPNDDICEGDGTWTDAATGSSFTIIVSLSCMTGGAIDASYSAWRLGDAIGGPLYERASF
jgi:hypothetical protein